MGVTAIGAPAQAAVGDYTVQLDAPETRPIYRAFSYTVTLETELAGNTASGIVLTATLPAGIDFDAVPTGPETLVASASWNATTRVVTFTLNPVATEVSSFVFSVRQVNNDPKYPGLDLTTTGSSDLRV